MSPQGGPNYQQFQGGSNQGGFGGIHGGNQQQQPFDNTQGKPDGQYPPPSGQPGNQQPGGVQR